jgi:hypothetical protein
VMINDRAIGKALPFASPMTDSLPMTNARDLPVTWRVGRSTAMIADGFRRGSSTTCQFRLCQLTLC